MSVHVSDVGQLGALVTKSMQAQVVASAQAIARRQAGHATAGLPQAVVNSAVALKQRANTTTAKARQSAATAVALKRDAEKQADAARAALAQGNKQKAGAHIVQHLTDLREGYKAAAVAAKGQKVAAAQSRAANVAQAATKLREAANTQFAVGNQQAATQLAARAEIAERQKMLAVNAAEVVASAPMNIPVPAELEEQAIVAAASRYTVRVARRDGAHLQSDRALLAVLGGMTTDDAGFRNPTAILAEYGGGPVGLVFAGAEMGNLSMYHRGMGSLGNWFTDAMKLVGVDEKTIADTKKFMDGAQSNIDKFVKGAGDVQKAFTPPAGEAKKVAQAATKPPSTPQVKSPTTAPALKAGEGTYDVKTPELQQDVRRVTGVGMGTGTKVAIGAGVIGALALAFKLAR